jgi:hypothetical protein
MGFVSLRRQAKAKAIAIFAVFAQLVATCYVQATWIDLSRTFYFEKMAGVVFWALLLGLFSYALLRGIADSLTGKMADPSLYGARVREAWNAWRELPRYRIVQRADLMAQLLYLVLTGLCIFYLVVISIDWYDGVIRIGETWYRQIAIDGKAQLGSTPHVQDEQKAQLVSAQSQPSGRVLGTVAVEHKSNEIPAARALLNKLGPLDGKLLMLDALHPCQQTLRQAHQDNGADFLIPVKGNHPELEARATACLPDRTPAVIPPLGRAPGHGPAADAVRYRRKRG